MEKSEDGSLNNNSEAENSQTEILDLPKLSKIEDFLEIQLVSSWPKGTTKAQIRYFISGALESLLHFKAINQLEYEYLYPLYCH